MGAIWPGALVAVYLVATGVLLVAGGQSSALDLALHFGMLSAVTAAALLPGIPAAVRAWLPLATVIFLYSEIPLLLKAAGHSATADLLVQGWERSLFGGQPALAWADSWPHPLISETLHAAYLAYYPLVVAVPVALYLAKRRREFDEAVFVLIATFLACFVFYLFFPVAGPRYVWAPRVEPDSGFFRTLTLALLDARSSRGTAFPSSHVAVAVTQTILAARYYGARGAGVGIVAVLLAAGAIYGGFHYAIDVIAGAAAGVLVAGFALAAWGRVHGVRYANARAPT